MRIISLRIRNFRTIESLEVDLHPNYTAICGPNDSGKTNVIRAVRTLLRDPEDFYPFSDQAEVAYKDDFPKWKDTSNADSCVTLSARLEIHKSHDAGLYQSTLKQLSVTEQPEVLVLDITVTHAADKTASHVAVTLGDQTFDGLEAQEVLNRIQTAKSIVLHNSTQMPPRTFFRGGPVSGVLQELSPENQELLSNAKKKVNSTLTKIARGRQKEFEELLGKLERKYKVGLTLPTFELSDIPFSITLGDSKVHVRLDEWGSGTRNRTQVLLALFTAKTISDTEESAAKTTPIIIIEEPECFLHPSAQAEFGRVIRDLADEFQIQVIMTTHSPYMLSLKDPSSNMLLKRRSVRGQLRETQRIDTAGENWMQPFAEALGLESDEFEPWKKLFNTESESIFLVEGETDKQYFEMLRSAEHEDRRLDFVGEIVPYNGTGAISNTTLLQFIRSRYKNVFITFDLDAEKNVARTLERIGLSKNEDFMAIGVRSPGRQNIEGLLPDHVKKAVRDRVPELVDAASQGTGDEQKSARNELKKQYLAEFRNQSKPGDEYYAAFYPIVRAANKRLQL